MREQIQYIDISKLFNHKMFCAGGERESGNGQRGIDGFYFSQEEIEFFVPCDMNGQTLVYRKDALGNDNVVAEGQTLSLKTPLSFQTFTVFGFSVFGMFTEYFQLILHDGERVAAKAHFNDMGNAKMKMLDLPYDEKFHRDGAHIFQTIDARNGAGDVRKSYMYYYTTEYFGGKRLKSIIFPDNECMNIFAITLRGGEENGTS